METWLELSEKYENEELKEEERQVLLGRLLYHLNYPVSERNLAVYWQLIQESEQRGISPFLTENDRGTLRQDLEGGKILEAEIGAWSPLVLNPYQKLCKVLGDYPLVFWVLEIYGDEGEQDTVEEFLNNHQIPLDLTRNPNEKILAEVVGRGVKEKEREAAPPVDFRKWSDFFDLDFQLAMAVVQKEGGTASHPNGILQVVPETRESIVRDYLQAEAVKRISVKLDWLREEEPLNEAKISELKERFLEEYQENSDVQLALGFFI